MNDVNWFFKGLSKWFDLEVERVESDELKSSSLIEILYDSKPVKIFKRFSDDIRLFKQI